MFHISLLLIYLLLRNPVLELMLKLKYTYQPLFVFNFFTIKLYVISKIISMKGISNK